MNQTVAQFIATSITTAIGAGLGSVLAGRKGAVVLGGLGAAFGIWVWPYVGTNR